MTLRETLQRAFSKPYASVTPVEAQALAAQGAVLLDVREPHEWQAGRAPKARHIPLGDLARRSRELPAQRQVLVICRSGRRSAQAATLLADAGYSVANVSGGMSAWERSGLPVVATGGGPGRVV